MNFGNIGRAEVERVAIIEKRGRYPLLLTGWLGCCLEIFGAGF
jgi:hypothetical protein